MSLRERGGANGDGGGPLRPLREGEEEAKKRNEALGVTSTRWGFNWRALARRGLRGQDIGDVRRHAALKI